MLKQLYEIGPWQVDGVVTAKYTSPCNASNPIKNCVVICLKENDLLFNRGMLMNIGFLESQHFSNWDCYVFHDVDQIPQSEFNPYECINMPRHFVSGADNRNYR